jgi:hypothetical protein
VAGRLYVPVMNWIRALPWRASGAIKLILHHARQSRVGEPRTGNDNRARRDLEDGLALARGRVQTRYVVCPQWARSSCVGSRRQCGGDGVLY